MQHGRKAQTNGLSTVSRKIQVEQYDIILREKLENRLSQHRNSAPRFIHLNFVTISRKQTPNGNATYKFMVLLGSPSGVVVDLTYLIGRVFGIRVVSGGLLSGEVNANDIRQKLYNRYGKQLKVDLHDFYINEI